MKGKKTKKRSGIILLCVSVPVLVLLFSLGAAQLALSGIISEDQLPASALIITAAIAFLLSLICGLRAKQKKFVWAFLTGCGFSAFLFLGNLMFFGVGFGKIWPNVLAAITAGILAGLLSGLKHRKYA